MNKQENNFPVSKLLTSAFLLVGHWWDWQWFSWYFTIWRFSTLWLDMIFQVISSRVVSSYLISSFKISNVLNNIHTLELLVWKFLVFQWYCNEWSDTVYHTGIFMKWRGGWLRWMGEKECSGLCILMSSLLLCHIRVFAIFTSWWKQKFFFFFLLSK